MGVVTLSIVVVDDDPGVRKALARLLRASGHRVETYESAEQFLGRRESVMPDCIVLDVNLDGMSGLDLYDRLRKAAGRAAVVFITGRDRVAAEEIRRRAPGTSCLLKPFDDSTLLDAVGRAVSAA